MSRFLPGQPVEALHNTGRGEQSNLSGFIADTGVKEIQTITWPATAAATQGDFVRFYNAAGLSIAAWLDIDADGTAPSSTIFTAATTKVKVSIATGDTAAQVAAAAQSALVTAAATKNITMTTLSAVSTLTQTKIGVVTDPTPKNAAENAAGSIAGAESTAGVASNWQNKYLLFSVASTDYYAWLNVNSEGVDPAVASRTGVEVAIANSASAVTVLAAVVAAIDALSGVKCVEHDGGLQIIDEASGDVTDATAGNSPATLGSIEQGLASNGLPGPASSPADFTNAPTLIS